MNARDKQYQRIKLKTANISDILFNVVDNENDAIKFANDIGYPVIIKPTHGSGSVGVRAYNNAEEFKSNIYFHFKNKKINEKLLIEEYFYGEQFSVEIFNNEVIGVTRQYYGALPEFVATGHDFPAMINDEDKKIIENKALNCAHIFNLMKGPLHIELRLNKYKRCEIIEINPRLAGGYIPEIVKYSTGIDLITNTIKFCVGEQIIIDKSKTHNVAIRFFINGVHSLDNLSQVSSTKDVKIIENKIYLEKLNLEVRYGDFRDRYGHLIFQSQTYELLSEQVNKVMNKLNINHENRIDQT